MRHHQPDKSPYPSLPLPPARTGSTTSSLPTPEMQNKMAGSNQTQSQAQGSSLPKQYTVGAQRAVSAQDTVSHQRQHQQQLDRDTNSQQQQMMQNHRQQQLAEMQHNLMLRQMQLSGARQQQQQPIMSHPLGHIHSSHSHAHYTPQLQLHLAKSSYGSPLGQAQGLGQGQGLRPGSKTFSLSLPAQRMFSIPEEGRGSSGAGPDSGFSASTMQNKNSSSSRTSSSHQATTNIKLENSHLNGREAIEALAFLDPLNAHSAIPQAKGYVGAYSPEARRARIERFLAKRDKRVWTKKVKYDVRKNFADSRLRVKVNQKASLT